MKKNPSDPIHFNCGKISRNSFMLAPMTNSQSNEDGTLSEDEYHWLTMRAKGGFGITMTCASHVQEIGKGFPGQLGIFSDRHIESHQKLSKGIQAFGSLAVIQLHHAGMRSPTELLAEKPICPSENIKHNARGISLLEIEQLRADFVAAAIRAKKSGYDGVEVHGAHGYIISQFLSNEINKRTDRYGGSLENRARLLFEIIDAIRAECGPNFLLGVRLSPERFGMKLAEVKNVSKRLMSEGSIDFLDISLWDVWKQPEEKKHQGSRLLAHFTKLDRKNVKLTVAGNIRSANDVTKVLEEGVDFVSVGRSGILHHNFPELVLNDAGFTPIKTPVSLEHLQKEGLSSSFINYMKRWDNFVKVKS